MGFHDHFSIRDAYARFRPDYPEELFAWLASLCPRRDLAWDSAAGNGQAAVALAPHFARVVASDASMDQLRHALPGRVFHCRALSERAPFPDASVDLVAVAQALHWLNLDAFYREARRVSRAGAVVAAWCYGAFAVEGEAGAAAREFYAGTVGPYWPPERRHVDAGYATLPFPFPHIASPELALVREWDAEAFVNYAGTWSAVKRYREETGVDPLPELARKLAPVWGPRRKVRWPLHVFAGRAWGPA